MALKLIERIRRHASVASGNFENIFKGADIPPLPSAISHLVMELGLDEPDFQKIGKMVSSLPEISAKVLQTVNSAYYSLPNPVNNVMHAVTVLGLAKIRPLILSFALKASLPLPPGNLFNQDAFWTDSLIKSLFARSFADHHCRENREEAFTAMLLADIALPLLLSSWGEYYRQVVDDWQGTSKRLSDIERNNFQWDHSQAGAWILQNWKFPVELVCFVGLHNSSTEKLSELGLNSSVALPVLIAAHTQYLKT
ncbi:MAG: HDOD domain-containing protein [bacterium]